MEKDLSLKQKANLLLQEGWQEVPDEPDWDQIRKSLFEDWDRISRPLQLVAENYLQNYARSKLSTNGPLGLLNPFNIPVIYGTDEAAITLPLEDLADTLTTNRVAEEAWNFKYGRGEACYYSEVKNNLYRLHTHSKARYGALDPEPEKALKLSQMSAKIKGDGLFNPDMLRRIVDCLGTPDAVFARRINNQGRYHFQLPLDKYSNIYYLLFESNTVRQPYHNFSINLVWDGIILDCLIEGDNAYLKWDLYVLSEKRPVIQQALQGCCLQVLSSGSQFGDLKANYPLESFYEETYPLWDQVTKDLDQGNCERYHVLIQGPPGTGKSEWIKSFAKYELARRGYFIIHLNYDSKELLERIPKVIPKVAVMINEADKIVPNRDHTINTGESEKMLEQFDQNNDMVEPFYAPETPAEYDKQKLVVLMTCNKDEPLDPAFKREGRLQAMERFQTRYVNPMPTLAKDKLEAEPETLPATL